MEKQINIRAVYDDGVIAHSRKTHTVRHGTLKTVFAKSYTGTVTAEASAGRCCGLSRNDRFSFATVSYLTVSFLARDVRLFIIVIIFTVNYTRNRGGKKNNNPPTDAFATVRYAFPKFRIQINYLPGTSIDFSTFRAFILRLRRKSFQERIYLIIFRAIWFVDVPRVADDKKTVSFSGRPRRYGLKRNV